MFKGNLFQSMGAITENEIEKRRNVDFVLNEELLPLVEERGITEREKEEEGRRCGCCFIGVEGEGGAGEGAMKNFT